jgi:bacillolysin
MSLIDTMNFDRNSYDNAGAAIESTVHFGSRCNNAYWNGIQIDITD